MEAFTKRYMNVDDVAAYIDCPRSSIYKLVERREIPFIRLGPKLVKFDVKAIDEWMGKQAIKPARKENQFFVTDNVIDKVAHTS